MNDLLADQLPYWQRVEAAARELFADYGYREMRVPLVEHAELFKRSIGEHTDIVEKEMYTFDDRGGDRLSLRPEATAGLVRAAIEHGLLHNQKQRAVDRRAHVPPRAPAAGALPPVSPDRLRGFRLPGARHRRGNDPDLRAPVAQARDPGRAPVRELARHAGFAQALSRDPGRISSRRAAASSTRTACGDSRRIRCASSTRRTRRCRR